MKSLQTDGGAAFQLFCTRKMVLQNIRAGNVPRMNVLCCVKGEGTSTGSIVLQNTDAHFKFVTEVVNTVVVSVATENVGLVGWNQQILV